MKRRNDDDQRLILADNQVLKDLPDGAEVESTNLIDLQPWKNKARLISEAKDPSKLPIRIHNRHSFRRIKKLNLKNLKAFVVVGPKEWFAVRDAYEDMSRVKLKRVWKLVSRYRKGKFPKADLNTLATLGEAIWGEKKYWESLPNPIPKLIKYYSWIRSRNLLIDRPFTKKPDRTNIRKLVRILGEAREKKYSNDEIDRIVEKIVRDLKRDEERAFREYLKELEEAGIEANLTVADMFYKTVSLNIRPRKKNGDMEKDEYINLLADPKSRSEQIDFEKSN